MSDHSYTINPIDGNLLERHTRAGNSVAGLILKHSLEVRDFVFLSVICNQGIVAINQLGRLAGLGQDSVAASIDRLLDSQLVRAMDDKEASEATVRASTKGMLLASRLDNDVTAQ